MDSKFTEITNNPREFFRWLETASEGALLDFITKWHTKGETSQELISFIEFFRELSAPLEIKHSFDCAGTGGDKSNSFNISTATAFLVAYAGLPVIKNGGRSASSKVGSVDVLFELGLDLDIPDEKKLSAFKELGLSFFSSKISAEHLAPIKNLVRKNKSTSFINLIAPFLSPVELEGQLIGVAKLEWLPIMQEIAEYFIRKGYRKKVILVYSHNQDHSVTLDEFNSLLNSEITLISAAELHEQSGSSTQSVNPALSIKKFTINPKENLSLFNLNNRINITLQTNHDEILAELSPLEGGGTKENAQIILDLFQGKAFKGTNQYIYKAETLALNGALMLLLQEVSWVNYDLEQFLDKLERNYTELKGLLKSSQLYEFLSELRKYFTK